ncbi:MAG: hypothetical protein Q4D19_13975 [Lautropia sp.]|nr:hypothetical protein [Lautropia sp.]
MRYSHSTLVRAPIEDVFSFCTTRIGFCKYFSFPIYWNEGPERPGQGDTVDFSYKVFRRFWIRHCAEITVFERNQRYVDRMLAGPYEYFDHCYRFESKPEGTLVIEEVSYSLGYGRFIDRLIVKPFLDYLHARRHRLLKQIFEQPNGPAAQCADSGSLLEQGAWYDAFLTRYWDEYWLFLLGVRRDGV